MPGEGWGKRTATRCHHEDGRAIVEAWGRARGDASAASGVFVPLVKETLQQPSDRRPDRYNVPIPIIVRPLAPRRPMGRVRARTPPSPKEGRARSVDRH